jgi:hypothetical protein
MPKQKTIKIPVKLALRIYDYLGDACSTAQCEDEIRKSLDPLEKILLKRKHLIMSNNA